MQERIAALQVEIEQKRLEVKRKAAEIKAIEDQAAAEKAAEWQKIFYSPQHQEILRIVQSAEFEELESALMDRWCSWQTVEQEVDNGFIGPKKKIIRIPAERIRPVQTDIVFTGGPSDSPYSYGYRITLSYGSIGRFDEITVRMAEATKVNEQADKVIYQYVVKYGANLSGNEDERTQTYDHGFYYSLDSLLNAVAAEIVRGHPWERHDG